ncbi:hypothetical protein TWF696_008502 [Orbilia brochopaga]|uniref:Uncharacterized protein n=1 Tax=Orbilia brochopaga TaxID=3140254 RepID=A0AAV9UI50_9PEZI
MGLTDEWLRNMIPWRQSPSSGEPSTENGTEGSGTGILRAPPGLPGISNRSTSYLLSHRSHVPRNEATENQQDPEKHDDKDSGDKSSDGVDGGLDGANDDRAVHSGTQFS